MRTPVRLSRRTAIVAAAVLAAGTAGAIVLADHASAAPATPRDMGTASCTLATLNGTYLFDASGWSVSKGTATPVAVAGSERFDGAGHVHGIITSSEDGVITRGSTETGTYTVAANCTGTETPTVAGTTLHLDLFIAPSGNFFTTIETDPGSVLANPERLATRG